MTQVAIYARYSSDKQNPLSAENQIRVLRDHAKKRGWQVAGVYKDEEISGRKTKERPGYQAMREAAKAGEFDIVLVHQTDRLSRGLAETAQLSDILQFKKIEIHDLSGRVDPVTLGVKALLAQEELKKIAERTRLGLRMKVEKGNSGGGLCYGYDVPSKGVRRINPKQAEVVRRVFKEFAEGRGYREIAARLNADGIRPLRRKVWGGSSIRPMLRNEVYVGKLVWNRREWRWNPEEEKRQPETRSQSEWVVHDVPELRIVSDDLWEQVRKRREALETTHKARVQDGKKRPGKAPKHLFTGLLKCGQCGGKYIVANRSHVLCANRANRRQDDAAWCDAPSVRKDELERKLLHAIRTELFDEKSFEAFKGEVRRILSERLKSRNKDTAALKRDLAKTEAALEKLAAAIEAAGHSDTLLARLRTLETEKRRLSTELDAGLPPALANLEDLLEDALSRYARIAYSLEDFSRRDVTRARNLIRALVGGTIVLEATDGGGLQARLQGSYGGLIKLVQEASSKGKSRMVAGARNHLNLHFDAPGLA